MKKDQYAPNKNMFKVAIAQENNFQVAIVLIDYNPPIEIIFAEDHQIDEIQKLIHRMDIADQTARIISLETITLDQNQTEVIIQTVIRTVLIQTVGIDNIPMANQEKLLTIEIQTIQKLKLKLFE